MPRAYSLFFIKAIIAQPYCFLYIVPDVQEKN